MVKKMKNHGDTGIIEYDELMEILDISEPEEFEYFENMADLIECEHAISDEALIELFRHVDKSTLKELLENYFTDILENVPDRASDIYMLVNTIGMSLVGLAGEKEEDIGSLSTLAEEFNRFKKWYISDTEVECRETGAGLDEIIILTVAEALALCREEAITKMKYEYDFEKALDFPLSDYVMSFGDLAAAEYAGAADADDDYDDYDHDHDCDCGHDHEHDHSRGGHAHIHRQEGLAYGFATEDILNDGFVYDDEF